MTPDKRLFNQNVAINFTHVFTPNFVSSSKVIYNRLNTLQPLGLNPVSPTLYTSATALPALPGTNGSLVFPGYSETTPGNAIPFGGPQNLYQFYEDLNWTKGKHQFKFGGDYIQTRDNRVFGAFENAVESLSSGGSISEAAANLVAGQLFQFQGASFPQGKFPCSKDASGTHHRNSGLHTDPAGWSPGVWSQQPLQRRSLVCSGFLESNVHG